MEYKTLSLSLYQCCNTYFMREPMRSVLNLVLSTIIMLTSATLAMATDSQPTRDGPLVRRIEILFAQHAELGTTYSVQAREGVVYLGGFVTTDISKANAQELVRALPGVRNVVNGLTTID